MKTFRALRVSRDGAPPKVEDLPMDALPPGEALIRVRYSGVNYKDALAGTAAVPILRKPRLTGGIDLAGVVEHSDSPALSPGDEVLVNGCGLSETHDGGYAEYARVPADWVVPMPAGLDARAAMVIGTAGFTAALALHVMERNGQTPGDGPILVTGATGGVGGFALALLSAQGYECVAATRKAERRDYLLSLGAREVVAPPAPVEGALGKAQWGGAIDNLGGRALEAALRTTRPWGNVVSVGLAESPDFAGTVMPHVVRGVSLLGVSSTNCPMPLRRALWEKLGGPWRLQLDRIAIEETDLDGLPACFRRLLDGTMCGRFLVAVGG